MLDVICFLLVLISAGAALIALIKPNCVGFQSRIKGFFGYSLLSFGVLLGVGLSMSDEELARIEAERTEQQIEKDELETEKKKKLASQEPTEVDDVGHTKTKKSILLKIVESLSEGDEVGADEENPPSTLTIEENISQDIKNILVGKVSTGDRDKFRALNVTVGGKEEGDLMVVVDFNGSENLTNNLTSYGIKSTMSKIHTAAFKYPETFESIVTAYMPLIDKYGNRFDGVVYRTKLTRDEAGKINWALDETLLNYDIIPGVWEAYKVHSSMVGDR